MKDKIFGVLQRVGRSFMLPIALLPVAGLLLGIGSGLFYSSYTLFGRVALSHYPPFTVTFYTFLVAGIGSLFLIRPQELAIVTGSGRGFRAFIGSCAGGAGRVQPPNSPKKLVCVMPSTRNRRMRANSTPMMMSIWWTVRGNLS